MIGGVIFWEPARELATRSVLDRMAGRGGTSARVHAVHAGVGVFASTATEMCATPDHLIVAADLDLTNLGELLDLARVGADDLAGMLSRLYAMDGPDFVRRLRGGFALALWDRAQQTLLVAVDHFGIKRLHHVTDARRTAFASRPSALLAAPDVEAQVDPASVYSYLNFGYVPAPGSIFRSVSRLPPGQRVVVRTGTPVLEPYWDMTYPERSLSRREAARRVYELAEASVSRAIRGTEPKALGAFLSGGTDSSTIVGLMSRLTGERVNAFSIGFAEERYNELHYADVAARHFGAAHYTRIVTPGDALALLPRLIDAYDEPFANNSAIGTLACAQLARECGVTRLLAGDGGDEIFGGNERYRTDRIFAAYQWIPAPLRLGVVEPLLRRAPDDGPRLLGLARRYVRRATLPNPERFYSYEFFFSRDGQPLLAPDFLAAARVATPFATLKSHYDRVQAESELNRLLYLDLKLTIGDNDLLKVTRTAELAGLGLRFPMLDLSLVELTGTLPAWHKVRRFQKRYLFRRAFRGLLPAEILAKRKHGFGVPTSSWLKSDPGFSELAHDVLLSSRARQRGYFRRGALEEIFHLHATDSTPYYGDVLWNLLMLELWHRRHADARSMA